MSRNTLDFLQHASLPKNNREIFFLFVLLAFAIFARIIPFSFITAIALFVFIFLVSVDFYFYANKAAREENKNAKITEYSWGFVQEKRDLMDIVSLSNYLFKKDFGFYKQYVMFNSVKIVFIVFIFGDMIVAFKNLDFKNAGIYIAMSLFCKFVFAGLLFMKHTYEKVIVAEKNTEENILEIFYTQINTLISLYAVLFVFFFVLSKYISDIFFGDSFSPVQSSLPFVLLANIALATLACVYITAIRLDERVTRKISKMFTSVFIVLFIFMSINYIDTIAYFVIGTSALLSIFLYNFVIKKPEYIKSTYNFLF